MLRDLSKATFGHTRRGSLGRNSGKVLETRCRAPAGFKIYIGGRNGRGARGWPSMVKGAALRSLSRRGSQVQILPHAFGFTH